jgi:hypothetical protein
MLADRVRVFAEIPHYLHHALLRRRRPQRAGFPDAQQSPPRQLQNGVVRRRRPREKPAFHFAAKFFVAALPRANPQPRQNHIHRQVRHARRAEQTAWSRRSEGASFSSRKTGGDVSCVRQRA